jgi:hypothetical protein
MSSSLSPCSPLRLRVDLQALPDKTEVATVSWIDDNSVRHVWDVTCKSESASARPAPIVGGLTVPQSGA